MAHVFQGVFRLASSTRLLGSDLSLGCVNGFQQAIFYFNKQYASRHDILQDKYGRSMRRAEEMHELGFKEFAKKNRSYAQYNYEEWRYPQSKRPIDISCLPEIIEPYKEKDRGMKSTLSNPKKSLTDMRDAILHSRILKKRVPEFHKARFPPEAQEIYINAHNLLNTERWSIVEKDKTRISLHNLVTEHAYPNMVAGLHDKRVIWEWLESIESPKVVQIKCAPMIDEENFYSQVTVRMHSKQKLAVYDRFGRLMYGSADGTRRVFEYVVFERHISNPYGMWRIQGKTDGPDMEREPITRTISFAKPHPQREEADEWHKEEQKIHPMKWYPKRLVAIQRDERMKRFRQGNKYWRARRRFLIRTVHYNPPPAISGKARRLTTRKTVSIKKMIYEGKLPRRPVEPPKPFEPLK